MDPISGNLSLRWTRVKSLRHVLQTQIPKPQSHRFQFSSCAWALESEQIILRSRQVWDPVEHSRFLFLSMMNTLYIKIIGKMLFHSSRFPCMLHTTSARTKAPYSLNLNDTGHNAPDLFSSSKEAGTPACPGHSLRLRDVPGPLCFPILATSTPDPAPHPHDGSRCHSWRF